MKLKSVILALALGMAAVSANACDVPTYTDSSVRAVVVQNGGWPIPDSWCPILAANPDIKLMVSADNFVGMDRSVAWAMVTIRDGFGVVAPNNQTSTRIAMNADSTTASGLEYVALSHALNGYDLQGNINWIRQHDHKLINYITSQVKKNEKSPGTGF